jgi:hypothetical protein
MPRKLDMMTLGALQGLTMFERTSPISFVNRHPHRWNFGALS